MSEVRPTTTTTTPTTRLAPSPTGALHLGNARTFLINWALARQNAWHIVLRIEDLDTPRIKKGADTQAIDDLTWLGIDWDDGPHYQRHALAPYQDAINALHANRLIYPCPATRSDLVEVSAPHAAPHSDHHELRYPGTHRPYATDPAQTKPHAKPFPPPPQLGTESQFAWRLIIPDEPLTYQDLFAGPQSFNVQQTVGDFIVVAKSGLPAYQLAVVVDDARQNITHIVRGNDLLSSAARQLWLYRLLNLTPQPHYIHTPLIAGEDGRRLAKRHGDTRLAQYRQQGVTPERIIGLIATWSGILHTPEPLTAIQFRTRFTLENLPPNDITMTPDHHAWLTA